MRSETRWCWAGDPTYQGAPDALQLRVLPDRLDVIYSEALRLASNCTARLCLIPRQDDKGLKWSSAMHQVFAVNKVQLHPRNMAFYPVLTNGASSRRSGVKFRLTHYPRMKRDEARSVHRDR
jgi:hypothetical protein